MIRRPPESSSFPRARTRHQADRVLVTAALSGAGNEGPTPGTPRPATLVAEPPDAARPQHVPLPPQPPAHRGGPVVDLPRELRALATATEPKPPRPRRDGRAASRAARKAEPEVERLEPVGELDLVPLGAAEELRPGRALPSCEPQRVERVHDPGRKTAVGGIEREPVQVHLPLEHEVPAEGDRPATDLRHHDPGRVDLRESLDDGAGELLPGGRHEPGAVRAALPAQLVQAESVLEHGFELIERLRMDELDLSELRELAASVVVMAALARIRLCAIRGLPAVGEIQHGRLDPLEQLEPARTVQRREATLVGEAEQVDVVVLGREDAVDERLDDLLPLGFRDQRVREHGLARADEVPDPQAVQGERDQRQGADEPVSTESDLDGEAAALAVMAPPLDEPTVQEERAGPRHRPDEGVPRAGERDQPVLGIDRLEPQRSLLPGRLENGRLFGDASGHEWVITH